MTTLTRVAFCKKCYESHRPKTDQKFLVHGSQKNIEQVRFALRVGVRGFTPHIITLEKVIGTNVIYTSLCSMHGCGVDIFYDKDNKWGFYYYEEERSKGVITIESWNAWTKFRGDTGYEI